MDGKVAVLHSTSHAVRYRSGISQRDHGVITEDYFEFVSCC